MWRVLRVAMVVCIGALALSYVVSPEPAHAQPPDFVLYTEPTTSAVIDFFRPPSTFAGAGNRGWQYSADDTLVSAAADGSVFFAGPIGDEYYVTLSHGDGLRTTYSFLTDVWVVQGQQVTAGLGIAQAGPAGLHFGVYAGSHYLDPEVLFAASQSTPRRILAPAP